MLDANALQQLVEQQIKTDVSNCIRQTMTDAWFAQVETDAIKFIQDRIVAKFANSEAMPELITAVKSSVHDLFKSGQIPGLGQYVDYDFIKQAVNDSSQQVIQTAIDELSLDAAWLEKIEQLISQQTTQRVLASLTSVDIRPIIKSSVDAAVKSAQTKLLAGIENQTSSVELTVMDKNVVIENTLTARNISAVESATVKDLVITGSVNTDNKSWTSLIQKISDQTLASIDSTWQTQLVEQVRQTISQQGINFDRVTIDGQALINGDTLSSTVTQSKLKSLGTLDRLTVEGNTKLNETVVVNRKRVGINTEEPDMALSLWDEEVAVSLGKFKSQTGYIGTTRKQGLTIGINRTPAIEIDDSGLTAVKKIQVGLHRISHATEVPNYAGTKGDIVFNASPSLEDSVFAWQCLGGFKWKVVRAVQ